MTPEFIEFPLRDAVGSITVAVSSISRFMASAYGGVYVEVTDGTEITTSMDYTELKRLLNVS